MNMQQTAKITEIEDDEEEIEDETIVERIVGLTEMFPERLRNMTCSGASLGVRGVKALYKFTRSSMWVGATSFIILVVPIVFEQEKFNLEQQQLAQQRQMLLGPNAAVSGALGGIPGGMAPPPIPSK